MLFLFVFGRRSFAACDYFEYQGRTFYVIQQFFHACFAPCCSTSQPMLVSQENPGRGFWVGDLGTGVENRTMYYTFRQNWTIVVGVFLALLSIFLAFGGEEKHPIYIILLLLALATIAVGIWFCFQKPKATEEHKQIYIRKLQEMVLRSRSHTGLTLEQQQAAALQQSYQPPPYYPVQSSNTVVKGQPVSNADVPFDVALDNDNALGKDKDDVEMQQPLI